MGLFTKKKKKNVFDPREQYVPEVVYDEDLTTTLVKTIGIGSKDSKRVSVEYEDDVLNYYFNSGVLVGVESQNTSLELYQRFYWIDKENFDEESLEKIAELADELELHDFFATLFETYPDYVDMMFSILRSRSIQLLMDYYDKEIKSVQLEVFQDEDEQKAKLLSLLNIDSRNIESEVSKEREKTSNLIKSITESKIEETTLEISDSDYQATTDLEKLVWAAAESESSLEMILQLSKGFLWSEILYTISNLSSTQKITVNDPSRIVEEIEELPDLDFMVQSDSIEEDPEDDLPQLESTDEQKDEESVVGVSDIDEDDEYHNEEEEDTEESDPFGEEEEWSYSKPADDHEKDDGGFEYENTSVHDEDITLTQYLLDDFEFNVKVALAEEEFDRNAIVEISSLLRNNRELEAKTVEVEEKISPLQTNYDNRFAHFQHLSINKTAQDENIVGEDIEEMRELSNDSFRELFDLEEERFEIGEERKGVLQELENHLVNLSNENSQELLYRLEQKRKAIDNVVNLAYQTVTEDDNVDIDPAFLAAVEPTPEDTPMFQQLMNKYGDPFKTLTK